MDAKPTEQGGKGSLDAAVDRWIADLVSVRANIDRDPALSEEERARLVKRLLGDRDDIRKARRVLFRHMTSDKVDCRLRVKAATGIAWLIAGFVQGVRAGDNKRVRQEARHAMETDKEKARQGVITAISMLSSCGDRLDRWTFSRYVYSTAINVLGKHHGIACEDGLLSEKLGALLSDVAAIFEEPFPVSDVPKWNPPEPESELDHLVCAVSAPFLGSMRATARMLVELREALGLKPTTAEQAYQRIRRAQANGRTL
jgi:hypothetical protein